jgi:hypothetical protein
MVPCSNFSSQHTRLNTCIFHSTCHLTVSWYEGGHSFPVLIIVRHTYCSTQWAAIVSSGHPVCTIPLITGLVQQGSLIRRRVAMSSASAQLLFALPTLFIFAATRPAISFTALHASWFQEEFNCLCEHQTSHDLIPCTSSRKKSTE